MNTPTGSTDTMGTIAVMTGQTYRAAFAVAPKKDVRPYLNGIHIDTARGVVVATCGHVLYKNNVELGLTPGDAVIFKPVKIPAGADTVEVCSHGDGHVMLYVSGPRIGTTMHVCELIEGAYPNYEAVIPTTSAERSSVLFNVQSLAVLKQIFGRVAEFEPGPVSGACKITGADGEGVVVLMESRR